MTDINIKNTIIKQTKGCHWYTVMLKINYPPLSFKVINKTKKRNFTPQLSFKR